MTTLIKKAQFATANNSKVGDKLQLLCIPYYCEDMRIYYIDVTIKSIELSKTGKRVKITYDNGMGVSNIGLNTYFQELTEKFLNKISKERGWREKI